jgi:hypothetical protein
VCRYVEELVNLGKKLNVADAQSKTYKKIIFFLLFFAIAAIAATFLACLGAVEAAKDSRPDSGGTLLTTSITGKTKVVQTQKHINTVAITDLYMAGLDVYACTSVSTHVRSVYACLQCLRILPCPRVHPHKLNPVVTHSA